MTGFTAGAVFTLYDGTAAPSSPTADFTPNSCTILAGASSCTITVLNTGTGGAIHNKQYWVVETTASSGTFTIPNIGVGANAVADHTLPYPGRTPPC